MYLLDTNILIEFLRGRLQYAYDNFVMLSPKQFGLPAVVEAELLLGVEKSSEKRRADNRLKAEKLIQAFDIVPFDDKCAREYALVRAYLEARGCVIGPNDMLIAATALANQAVLVTNNDREFARVPGLQVECWQDIELP